MSLRDYFPWRSPRDTVSEQARKIERLTCKLHCADLEIDGWRTAANSAVQSTIYWTDIARFHKARADGYESDIAQAKAKRSADARYAANRGVEKRAEARRARLDATTEALRG